MRTGHTPFLGDIASAVAGLITASRDATSRHEALARLAQSANVEVWLGWSPPPGDFRNAIFGHQVLAELGNLGIDLVLDPYPAGSVKRSREAAPPPSTSAE